MERLAPHLDRSLDDLPGEEWRDVVGYDGYYSVSNLGRVKSEPRLRKTGKGNCYYMTKAFIRKQTHAHDSQYYVALCVESVVTNRTVSTIVADAFLREKKEGEVVMHRNKIQSDNKLSNLIITTKSESTKRSYELEVMHSTLPVDRDKYKLSEFGIYKENQLVGRICRLCEKEKSLTDFYKDLMYCKDCYAKKKGRAVEKIGVRRKFVELRKEGLQPCFCCKEVKSFDEFRKDKHRINGIVSICKSCQRESEIKRRLSLKGTEK